MSVNSDVRIHTQKSVSRKKHSFVKAVKKNYQLYLFLVPTLLYFFVFKYLPFYGLQIAFKNYISGSMWNAPWVGLDNFIKFFYSYQAVSIITNTLKLSFTQLIFGFPIPIILALMLNQTSNKRYKKFVQTVVYAPHFISTVVLVGLLQIFLSPRMGIVNHLIEILGGERIFFFARPDWFIPTYVISDIWQNAGWGTIVYLAALSGISPELHEAALVDGANKWQRVWHIDIPGIIPTAVILLILQAGRIANVGFEKVFLMQTDLNLTVSEVVSTYVYKLGLLQGAQFSYSTAVGLMESMINMVLILSVNAIAKRFGEMSLF